MALNLRTLDRLILPKAALATALRWSSSSGHTINDKVKGKLKELYRRVHPDFFHSAAPNIKQANEKSFKLLQEYLSAADHKYGGGGHPNLPYKFNFYIKDHAANYHQTDADSDKVHEKEEPPLPTFKEISLTLPPPNRALPHTTHHALSKLFTACGIQASAAEMTSGGDIENTTAATGESLSVWLPGVAELYHQSVAASLGGPRQELQAIRTSLQLTHRISLSFGGKLASGSVVSQIDAARRLMTILDQCPPEICGLRIGLGDGFGTDPDGIVWLYAEAQTATWLEYLRESDVLNWCQRRREKQMEDWDKETKAARLLDIYLIRARDPDVSHSEEYERFLNKLLEDIQQGELSTKNLNLEKVVVHVIAADPVEKQRQIVSDGFGRLIVPVSSSTTDLLSALRRLGPEAQRCAEILDKEDEELANLKTRVERKLHLRKLLRHPALPAHKYKAGCLRMLQYSSTLGPLLDGLPVQLGEVNAFFPGQSHIDISWSFSP
jgi:Domain of unknown function (DUF4461)/Domain of unknown function (DUF4460)